VAVFGSHQLNNDNQILKNNVNVQLGKLRSIDDRRSMDDSQDARTLRYCRYPYTQYRGPTLTVSSAHTSQLCRARLTSGSSLGSTRRPEQPPQGRGQSASGSPRASTRADTRRHPPDPTVDGWHRASERPPRARPRGARRRATAPTRRLLPCGCAVQLAGAAAPGATTVIGLVNSAASPGRTAAAASVISVASCAAAAVPTPSGTS
jgi:hypothetical protein